MLHKGLSWSTGDLRGLGAGASERAFGTSFQARPEVLPLLPRYFRARASIRRGVQKSSVSREQSEHDRQVLWLPNIDTGGISQPREPSSKLQSMLAAFFLSSCDLTATVLGLCVCGCARPGCSEDALHPVDPLASTKCNAGRNDKDSAGLVDLTRQVTHCRAGPWRMRPKALEANASWVDSLLSRLGHAYALL
jgi:hypothetical protein